MAESKVEPITYKTALTLEKYDDYGILIETVTDNDSNLLTTAGATRLASLLVGTGQSADATHTLLGTGSSATAAAITDAATDLGGSQYWKVQDSTYPSAAAGVVTLKSSFATGEGNYAWASWGIQITTGTAADGATPGAGILFNRKVAALGTKASGVWALTITLTFA